MAWHHELAQKALNRNYYTWDLERPEPALPSSYFWTWDHSTNWVLDDPGMQNTGCYNAYYKHPDTFAEDYRRLTDLAAGLGVRGIVIWGFLRDAHGGVEYGKRVASYGGSRGVDIMPGFGTTWYGGAYYEGDHPLNLQVFLAKYPEARMLGEDGEPYVFNGEYGACPAHPAYREWLLESIDWIYREFEIGGVNLENGDYLVDYHPLTQAARASWSQDDPEVFFFQGLSYRQALEAIGERLPETLATYAIYTGFHCTNELVQNTGIPEKHPAMFGVLPSLGVCQWTLTGMLLPKPLPLTAYLDNGAPAAAFDNPNWPADLRPSSTRSAGFVHQGSQWHGGSRYYCIVSTIKEACLRAYRSGLEGVAIHGEVTNRWIPAALNYLAFSHFIHWPEDSLRDFGKKTLSQVLGSQSAGEAFVDAMAHWDAGTLTDTLKSSARPEAQSFSSRIAGSSCKDANELQRYNFWRWLSTAVKTEPGTKDVGVLAV